MANQQPTTWSEHFCDRLLDCADNGDQLSTLGACISCNRQGGQHNQEQIQRFPQHQSLSIPVFQHRHFLHFSSVRSYKNNWDGSQLQLSHQGCSRHQHFCFHDHQRHHIERP